MQDRNDDVPMSIPLPKDLILNKFGRYFTNSISWELALAIHEGFEEIYVFGVDMAQDEEYKEQRPSCEYFIGMARGAGIKVHLPDECDLLKSTWLYPFEDDAPFRVKCASRRQELRQRMNESAGQEQAGRDGKNQLIGALENMNYIEKTWASTVGDNQMSRAPSGV